MRRSRRLQFLPPVMTQMEARKSLRAIGDAIVVKREVPRTLVLLCPDGCGEILTVNLDSRTGKAWRIYEDENGITLFPSVWRDTGCESHFIIWDNIVLWLDGQDDEQPRGQFERLREKVLNALFYDRSRSYVEVADELGLIPWRVQRVCDGLVLEKSVVEDRRPRKGHYRRTKR